MAGTSIGNLYGTVSLDARQYFSTLDRMQRTSARAFGSLTRTIRGVVTGFLALQAARGLTNLVSNSLQAVAAVDKLSQETGLLIPDLQVLSKASEFAGDSNLNLGKAMRSLGAAQLDVLRGVRGSRREFERLGITIDEIRTLTDPELFERVVGALGSMADETTRNNIAFRIFGKEAENLTGFFANGPEAFAKARREIELTGEAISELDAAKVRVALAAVDDLKTSFGVLVREVSVALTPVIFALSEQIRGVISNLDPEKLAKTIGGGLASLSAVVITVVERIELAFLKIERAFARFAARQPKPVRELIYGAQNASEEVERLTGEIEALEAAIDAVTISVESDFQQRIEEIMQRLTNTIAGVSNRTTPELERLNRDLEHVQTTIEDGLTDSLAEFITTGKSGFRELAQVILKELVAALIRAQVVSPILNALGLGTGGGLLKTVFGGGKAAGGPVTSGRAYVVGEQGPELFVPRSNGAIVPHDKMGGAGSGVSLYVTNHFAPGVSRQDLAASIPMIVHASKTAALDQLRRMGRI